MLAAIDVRLYPTSDCKLPHPCAHAVHAALLSIIRDDDPTVSALLHDSAQNKPFSVSTLLPKAKITGDELIIPKLTQCRFRLCTVGRDTFDIFSKALFTQVATNSSFKLGNYDFVFQEPILAGSYGGLCTLADIIKEERTKVTLRFSSPTAFKRKGITVPIPDPELVYGSLWQKWQTFSPVKVEQDVFDEMISALAVSALDINSRAWKYPKYLFKGFVGLVEFELVHNVSSDAGCLFNALSELSFYTGVGYKTTMGMGQCGIYEKPETPLAVKSPVVDNESL